jgi:hypothetical protein
MKLKILIYAKILIFRIKYWNSFIIEEFLVLKWVYKHDYLYISTQNLFFNSKFESKDHKYYRRL